MPLNPYIADPAEAAISRLIRRELDEAVAASGSGEAFRHRLMSEISHVIANGVHNLVEPVATVAPGTGHLIVGFRIGDGFYCALAAAAENITFSRTH